MRKVSAIVLFAAALPLLADKAVTVSAQGYASYLVLPDAAIVNVAVEVWGKDISELPKKADESLSELSLELAKAGLREPLRQDGYANLTPWYSAEEVQHSLSLTVIMFVDNLAILGDLLGVLPMRVSRYSDAGMRATPSTIQYTIKDTST